MKAFRGLWRFIFVLYRFVSGLYFIIYSGTWAYWVRLPWGRSQSCRSVCWLVYIRIAWVCFQLHFGDVVTVHLCCCSQSMARSVNRYVSLVQVQLNQMFSYLFHVLINQVSSKECEHYCHITLSNYITLGWLIPQQNCDARWLSRMSSVWLVIHYISVIVDNTCDLTWPCYTAGNAPYFNRCEAMNRWRGWSSLVVTQPSTTGQ